MTLQCRLPFKLATSWEAVLSDELEKPYIAELARFLEEEKAANRTIYPPDEDVFNAFAETPFQDVKVVIMGQDPYHGKGQAHGLSFSVRKGIPLPPSLKNIFKELNADLSVSEPKHGSLLSWARQGVLLLNATLTVRAGEPKSHYGKGWEVFTDAAIIRLLARKDPVIFVLWGKSAEEKCRHIQEFSKSRQHYVLTSAHPSPYSANSGFLGCRHFSKVNALLMDQDKAPIDWELR